MRRLRTVNRKGREKARRLSWDEQWTRYLWRSGCRDRWALAPAKRLFISNRPLPKLDDFTMTEGRNWRLVVGAEDGIAGISAEELSKAFPGYNFEEMIGDVLARYDSKPATAAEAFGWHKRKAKA